MGKRSSTFWFHISGDARGGCSLNTSLMNRVLANYLKMVLWLQCLWNGKTSKAQAKGTYVCNTILSFPTQPTCSSTNCSMQAWRNASDAKHDNHLPSAYCRHLRRAREWKEMKKSYETKCLFNHLHSSMKNLKTALEIRLLYFEIIGQRVCNNKDEQFHNFHEQNWNNQNCWKNALNLIKIVIQWKNSPINCQTLNLLSILIDLKLQFCFFLSILSANFLWLPSKQLVNL